MSYKGCAIQADTFQLGRRQIMHHYSRAAALIILVAAIGVATFVRVSYLNADLLNEDEAAYSACAARLIAFSGVPLVDCRDMKPPGPFLFYKIAFQLSEVFDMKAVRLLGALWVALTGVILWAAVRRLSGVIAAHWSATIYLLGTSLTPGLIAIKPEVLLNLPLCCALYCFVRSVQTRKIAMMALAGALLGVAVNFKQPAVLAAGALCATLAVLCYLSRDSTEIRFAAGSAAALVAGVCMTIAGVAFYYWAMGGLDEFVFQTWSHPRNSSLNMELSGVRRVMRIVTYTDENIRLFPLAGLLSAVAFIACCLRIIGWIKRRNVIKPIDALAWVLPPALLAAGFAAAILGPELYRVYYLMMLPAAAMAAAHLIASAVREGGAAGTTGVITGSAIELVAVICAASAFVVAMVDPAKAQVERRPEGRIRTVAIRIAELKQPGDLAFVWGFFPSIYLKAKILPSTRFTQSDILVGSFIEGPRKVDVAARERFEEPGGWEKFAVDLKRTPPRFIVDGSDPEFVSSGTFPLSRYPPIADFVSQRCKLDGVYPVASTGGIPVRLYLCK